MAGKIVEIIQCVLKDVTSSGLMAPRIEIDDWYGDSQVASVMIYSRKDSTGRGVSVRNDLASAEQLVAVADQVQEWVFEDFGATRSNWPQCPWHPNNHPLSAALMDDRGMWACPSKRAPVAGIGELGTN